MKAMGTPDVVSDGEVVEAQPPHRLVQTFAVIELAVDAVRQAAASIG